MKSLEERVEELERRVKELEAQPREYHYHAPVYVEPYQPPPPLALPTQPIPIEPYRITTAPWEKREYGTGSITWGRNATGRPYA